MSERFYVSETSGYKMPASPDSRQAGSQPKEVEVMVVDRAFNCAVVWRRYHRAGGSFAERKDGRELNGLRREAAETARRLNREHS